MEKVVNLEKHKTREFIFRNDKDFPLLAKLMEDQDNVCIHKHDFTECIIVIGGKGFHHSGMREGVPISRGDIIVVPRGGEHRYTGNENLSIINLLFESSLLPPVLMELYSHPVYKSFFMKQLSAYKDSDYPIFHLEKEKFDEIEVFARYLTNAESKPYNHCVKLGLFMVLLTKICNACMVNEEEIKNPPLNISKLIVYMEQNFHRQIYLKELTKLAAMSNTTLQRHFNNAFGVTPMIYLRNIRLCRAAEMLINPDLPLKEIASCTGFIAEPYFFRIFKKYFGLSPASYRLVQKTQNGKKIEIPIPSELNKKCIKQ